MDASSSGKPELVTQGVAAIQHFHNRTGSSGGNEDHVTSRPLPENPILPMFVQMNVRFESQDEDWRETSRYVQHMDSYTT